MSKKDISLNGQKFGRWTVVDTIPRYKNCKTYCLCICECGTRRHILRSALLDGSSKSCGCLAREKTSERSRKSYVGCVFGELVVIEMLYNYHDGKTYCKCQCSCGNEYIGYMGNLTSGHTKSCGCKTSELNWSGRRTNLCGLKFGKLTVIKRAENTTDYEGAFWECECDCGNTTITSGKRLRSGKTLSCGCLSSKGEAKISQILKEHGFNFKSQYSFSDCLTENGFPCKFDFAIFEDDKIKYLIEYDGNQHFIETNWDLNKNKKRDKIKDDYCLNNHLKLIRIPYTDFEEINIDYLLERMK